METDVCALAPSDWQIRTVEDVCERVTSGGTPSRREAGYYIGGRWPWVKTQELQDKWIDDTEEHITDEAMDASSAKLLPRNTVLLAMYGATVGQLGLLRRPMTCNQACCAMIVDAEQADYRYLFYQLLQARPQLKGLATGAAQQNLSGVLIRSLRFPFPSLSEQRAIAHILGALDDKIDLNRRMNETLEAMARAIFKSWFVDPTQAGLPKGWHEGKVEELLTLSRETINPRDFPHETFDHYSIPSFDEGRLPKAEAGEQIQSNKFLVPPGAVMISKLNPRIPRVWLPNVSAKYRSAASTEFLIAIPKPGISREWVYALFSSEAFLDVFATLVTGTSGSHQRVKPEYLLAMDLEITPKERIAEYTAVTKPLHARFALNLEKSRTLAALRDTLLPKLISGELRVKDPAPFLGGVVA